MRLGTIRLLVLTAALIATIGCGSDSPGGGDIIGPGDPGVPPPNPDGVLLDGNPGDNAVAATRILPPSPVDDFDIIDGLLTTRLDAAISPAATVGQVNDLLIRHDVRIVTMMRGDMFVTLKIPAVMDELEAGELADSLTADDVFLTAFPVHEIVAPRYEDPFGSAQRVLPPTGETSIAHLIAIGMPAAWNAEHLARSNNKKITVLVPDSYYSDDPHDEIDAMRFAQYGGLINDDTDGSNTWYPGNHGFHVAGILGANFDNTSITGTSPDPTRLLDVAAVMVTGLSWNDMFTNIVLNFPANGNFVISTSLGYPNKDAISAGDKYGRAVQALNWRKKVATLRERFVHATAAGNEAADHPSNDAGDARWGSPWSMASAFDDLRDAVPLSAMVASDSVRFERLWEGVTTTVIEAEGPLTNTIIVGSASTQGVESSFSNRNADLHVVGEKVAGPCEAADPSGGVTGCDGSVALYDGSSMATPQVAGLAAYLWNLKPSMSSGDVIDAISTNYENGLVDAFQAMLYLDQSIADAKVRKAIMDVAGATIDSPSNGSFNPIDIEKILAEFDSRNGALDWSRYDLNGDGRSGGGGTTEIDLDADGDISTVDQFIETASRSFDESAVSDLDMLCYYAWGPFFSGDPVKRRELLATCVPDPCPVIELQAGTVLGTTDCEVIKNLLTPDYPSSLLQELECDELGANWSFSASCATTYTEGSLACSTYVAQTPETGKQAISHSSISITDSLTVINPALTGTPGTLQLNIQFDGEMRAPGRTTSVLCFAQVFFWDSDNNYLGGFNERIQPGDALPQQLLATVNFIYGQPMRVNFRIAPQARLWELVVGGTSSSIKMNYSWLWIDGAADGSSYSWCSGLNFGNAGPPQTVSKQ